MIQKYICIQDLIVSLDSIMYHKVEDKNVYTFPLIHFYLCKYPSINIKGTQKI